MDNDLIDELEALPWGDVTHTPTAHGPRNVQTLGDDPTREFWELWRSSKDELKELGVAVYKDDMTGEFTVSWWQDPTKRPAIVQRAKLTPGLKTANYLDDDGRGTLDAETFALLKPLQRKMVLTHFMVHHNGHPFSLDASLMGKGKTYIALALAKTLGLNFGVICPANVVTKWTDTCIDVFNLEPEFVQSWERLRLGNCPDFCERIPMHRAHKFIWHATAPVLLIFDEVHMASGDKSLSGALLDAALDNPHIFSLGLSGTAADDPTSMRVLGRALGLHDGSDFWTWAKANGCKEAYFGGLEFTKNRVKAYEYLGAIHRHIFPNRGGRLVESDKTAKGFPHTCFVTPVDVPSTLPVALQKFMDEVETARDNDDSDSEAAGAVAAIRDRQEAELQLVPYVAERALQAVAEGKSAPIFCTYDSTLHALASMLPDPLYYNGQMSKGDKAESLRQFQAGVRPILILNLVAGSSSIDLHDLLGTHPRHSIIFPTFRAKLYAQASGRTDREGKASESVVEFVFLAAPTHEAMMTAVQRKLDNLSTLNDGELSALRVD